jgi:signal transduction histidine kinase
VTTAAEDAQRTRTLRLVNLRQELLAPVGAILGYGEILHEDALANGPSEIVSDLQRILTAARNLSTMVDQLLHPDTANRLLAGLDDEAAEHKLRHDLRTPINAVKGYGEMLLEDLDELGADRLHADIESLLVESNRLLSQIDSIVDLSRAEPGGLPPTALGESEATAMIAELMQSIRPVAETKVWPAETGNILVVDDMESNRELLARRLGRDGHHVTVAEGGHQALALMQAQDFDPRPEWIRGSGVTQGGPATSRHPGDHDLSPQRNRQLGPLH